MEYWNPLHYCIAVYFSVQFLIDVGTRCVVQIYLWLLYLPSELNFIPLKKKKIEKTKGCNQEEAEWVIKQGVFLPILCPISEYIQFFASDIFRTQNFSDLGNVIWCTHHTYATHLVDWIASHIKHINIFHSKTYKYSH